MSCLAGFRRPCRTLASLMFLLAVTLWFAGAQYAGQALQKGVSVELAVTHHATSMPDADKQNALIVTVTRDGIVFFGTDPVTPDDLVERVRRSLSGRAEEAIYVKADARCLYWNVSKVLDTLGAASVNAPALLTAQRDASDRMPVPPKGLKVLAGTVASPSVIVQVLDSGQQEPTFKINDENIPEGALQARLTQLLQDRSEKVALVKADGHLPFAHVVHVIDACRSAAASVVLFTPGLGRSAARRG